MQKFKQLWQRGAIYLVSVSHTIKHLRCTVNHKLTCIIHPQRNALCTWEQAQAMQLKRAKLRLFCLGAGLALAAFFTVQGQAMAQFAATSADIRADTLRLHIVANSNSVADQAVKLQVRDAILAEMDTLYQAEETLTKEESVALVMRNIPQFALAAAKALSAAGVQQTVALSVVEMYFDTTEYDNFTLPAGNYTALRVELGAANGKNWWCVLYPAFCLSSASGAYETDAENELICGDYALRFAALEWLEAKN